MKMLSTILAGICIGSVITGVYVVGVNHGKDMEKYNPLPMLQEEIGMDELEREWLLNDSSEDLKHDTHEELKGIPL